MLYDLVIKIKHITFALKQLKMVLTIYKNKDIEALFTSGTSLAYKAIMNKKVFVHALYAFKSILDTIDNVIELKAYQFLQYTKNSTFSSVVVRGSGVLGNILFSENEQGNTITIYELIINKDYGKE